MVAFAPGELATIAGPLGEADGDGPSTLVTKSFNVNDLPCPPQSVMVMSPFVKCGVYGADAIILGGKLV